MKLLPTLLTAAALLAATAVQAQTKWDLPAAYPATNFHSENLQRSSPPTSTRPPAAS